MVSAINWHDHYTVTKDRVVYVEEQHHIPGVHALARAFDTSIIRKVLQSLVIGLFFCQLFCFAI